MGFVDASAMPQLATVVQARYPNSYGSVYALADMALSTGYVVGPLLGSLLQAELGLLNATLIYAALLVSYTPVLFLCRLRDYRGGDDGLSEVTAPLAPNGSDVVNHAQMRHHDDPLIISDSETRAPFL